MTTGILYGCWGGLFLLCAGLGFLPEPTGPARAALMAAAVLFFVPGGVLTYRAWRAKDVRQLRWIRNLAIGSLTLTLAALVANFLAVRASEAVGQAFHAVLAVVSVPMLCAQNWVLSMFLWACLMVGSISCLKRVKKSGKN